MHGQLIPNVDPVGNDVALTPVMVRVPFIIFDNGTDCLWYPEAMDASAADRMVAMTMAGATPVAAYRVDLQLILPAAQHIGAAVAEPYGLICEPLRVQIRTKD